MKVRAEICLAVWCVLTSSIAVCQDGTTVCTLPPTAPFNPYSDQAGFSTDIHTYNPYSSQGLFNANMYHEPMTENDEPGFWAVKTYPVNESLNLNMQFDSHLFAVTTDGNGHLNGYGQYLELRNGNKAPVYFNYGATSAVLNAKIMPGEKQTIHLGYYQPIARSKWRPVTIQMTVKYWVSTGPAPTPPKRCSTNYEFYVNAGKSQAIYDAGRKYMSWNTYSLSFPTASSNTVVQFAGPIKFTRVFTPHVLYETWTNTGSTVALWYCDGDKHIATYEAGETRTNNLEGDEGHYGWTGISAVCHVAVAPADSPFSRFLKPNPYTYTVIQSDPPAPKP